MPRATRAPQKPTAPPRRRRAAQAADWLTIASRDIGRTLEKLTTNPFFITTVALAGIVVITHAGDIDHGPLAPWFPSSSTNPFVKWARGNVPKFFGLIIFAPAVSAVPPPHQLLAAITIAIWVMLVPEASELQYGFQALIFLLMLNVATRRARLLLLALAAALFLAGYLLPTLHTAQLVDSPSQNKAFAGFNSRNEPVHTTHGHSKSDTVGPPSP